MKKKLEEKLSKQHLYCNMEDDFDPWKQQHKKKLRKKQNK